MALVMPEFLQSQSYNAKRWRRELQRFGPAQAGVFDPGDFLVSGRGSDMALNVAAGSAWVPAVAGTPANTGYYHVQSDAVSVTNALSAASANPRLDQLCLRVNDTVDTASSSDTPDFLIVQGTPNAATTIDNRTGAAGIPATSNLLRIADILVPVGATSTSACTIRDRRPLSRGVLHTAAGTPADMTITTAGASGLGQVRLELGSNQGLGSSLVTFGFQGSVNLPLGGHIQLIFQWSQNGGSTWNALENRRFDKFSGSGQAIQHAFHVHYSANSLLAGNYLFRLAFNTSTGSGGIVLATSLGYRFYIHERPIYTANQQSSGSSP